VSCRFFSLYTDTITSVCVDVSMILKPWCKLNLRIIDLLMFDFSNVVLIFVFVLYFYLQCRADIRWYYGSRWPHWRLPRDNICQLAQEVHAARWSVCLCLWNDRLHTIPLLLSLFIAYKHIPFLGMLFTLLPPESRPIKDSQRYYMTRFFMNRFRKRKCPLKKYEFSVGFVFCHPGWCNWI